MICVKRCILFSVSSILFTLTLFHHSTQSVSAWAFHTEKHLMRSLQFCFVRETPFHMKLYIPKYFNVTMIRMHSFALALAQIHPKQIKRMYFNAFGLQAIFPLLMKSPNPKTETVIVSVFYLTCNPMLNYFQKLLKTSMRSSSSNERIYVDVTDHWV